MSAEALMIPGPQLLAALHEFKLVSFGKLVECAASRETISASVSVGLIERSSDSTPAI
jgi:hypothetical protein